MIKMNEEKTTFTFKEQTGIMIARRDIELTTGKVIVNNIEITSVEDWEKVTKSLIQLQNNWNELKEFVEKHIKRWEKEEQEWIKLGFMKVGGEANNKIIFKMVQDKMQELEGNNE